MDPRDWLFDRRIVRRNLEKGVLPVEQYEEHLSRLQDLKDECETVEASLYPSPAQDEADHKEEEAQKSEKTMENLHGVLDE